MLLYKTLLANYPDKIINVAVEEVSYGMEFIDSYAEIKIMKLSEALEAYKPNLLIILDANNIARCTRNAEEAKAALGSAKLAVIDHHEASDADEPEIFINQGSPAVTQDIYDICFNQLGLNKPEGYADLAMTGIYSDTGGFVHLTKNYKKSFTIVEELLEAGASIEKIKYQLNSYSFGSLEVLSKLLENTGAYKNFTYSYLDDRWVASKPPELIEQGIETYVANYLRNIDGRQSGFVVYKDLKSQKNEYKVSFRSLAHLLDVAEIAKRLGGGGHKPAAGARFIALDIEDAISKVKSAISEN